MKATLIQFRAQIIYEVSGTQLGSNDAGPLSALINEDDEHKSIPLLNTAQLTIVEHVLDGIHRMLVLDEVNSVANQKLLKELR